MVYDVGRREFMKATGSAAIFSALPLRTPDLLPETKDFFGIERKIQAESKFVNYKVFHAGAHGIICDIDYGFDERSDHYFCDKIYVPRDFDFNPNKYWPGDVAFIPAKYLPLSNGTTHKNFLNTLSDFLSHGSIPAPQFGGHHYSIVTAVPSRIFDVVKATYIARALKTLGERVISIVLPFGETCINPFEISSIEYSKNCAEDPNGSYIKKLQSVSDLMVIIDEVPPVPPNSIDLEHRAEVLSDYADIIISIFTPDILSAHLKLEKHSYIAKAFSFSVTGNAGQRRIAEHGTGVLKDSYGDDIHQADQVLLGLDAGCLDQMNVAYETINDFLKSHKPDACNLIGHSEVFKHGSNGPNEISVQGLLFKEQPLAEIV